jgi:hypothetical protein
MAGRKVNHLIIKNNLLLTYVRKHLNQFEGVQFIVHYKITQKPVHRKYCQATKA